MEKSKKNNEKQSSPVSEQKSKFNRRDILKSLSTVPVFGIFLSEVVRKQNLNKNKKNNILKIFNLNESKKEAIEPIKTSPTGDLVRIGIIGFGGRAESISRSCGFSPPDWFQGEGRIGERDYQERMNQDNINVAITGICEVFDLRAERGLATAQTRIRPSDTKGAWPEVKRYRTYQELLASDEIDAVIIAAPDHQHAQMTIDAVNAGKHVYCEKCMTRTEEEAHAVKAAVKKSGLVFQLGHQYSQSSTFFQAKEIVEKNILGKITLVETFTNRNTPYGAWIRHVDAQGKRNPGSLDTIDWKQWLGSRPYAPFSIEKYYNWPTFWDYSTGVVGELFSHEYDAINQLLDLGIPKSVAGSGGIYYYRDGRDTPDIFHGVFEYPDRELTVLYSASLACSRTRRRVLMGDDASMELGSTAKVVVDGDSKQFAQQIKSGQIDPSSPVFNYQPGSKGVDVVTSATQKYYASRGLIYTYQGGRRLNTAHLHLKEWIDVIRNGGRLSCGIDKAFEVTITCHMATKSYQEKRRVEWDAVRQRIV